MLPLLKFALSLICSTNWVIQKLKDKLGQNITKILPYKLIYFYRNILHGTLFMIDFSECFSHSHSNFNFQVPEYAAHSKCCKNSSIYKVRHLVQRYEKHVSVQ